MDNDAALSRVLSAVRKAQGALADYIAPDNILGPTVTVVRLLAILDDGDLNEALEKLEGKAG